MLLLRSKQEHIPGGDQNQDLSSAASKVEGTGSMKFLVGHGG